MQHVHESKPPAKSWTGPEPAGGQDLQVFDILQAKQEQLPCE